MMDVSTLLCSLALVVAASAAIKPEVHAFYYLWYGEPTTDGHYLHWNHKVSQCWGLSDETIKPHAATHS